MTTHNSQKASVIKWFRYVIWAVIVLYCGMSVYSAYGGYIRPSLSIAGKTAPLAVMAFPAVSFSLVVMTVLLACFRSKMAYAGFVTICICAPAIWNICPINIGKNQVSALQEYKTYKFITFNVMNMWDYDKTKHNNPDNRLLSFLIHSDADILSLQEIINFPDESQNSNVRAQLDSLFKIYPHRAQATNGALMVLSKYPVRRINLPQPLVNRFLPYAAFTVELPQGPITLFDCHLESIGLTDSDKASYQDITRGKANKSDIKGIKNSAIHKLNEAYRTRAIQINQLREAADSIGGNIIIAGDFNDVPLSYTIRSLKDAGFKEAYPSLAIGPGFTYQADRLYFRIDHILYRGSLRPTSLEIPKVSLSDHYPMTMTFLE